MKAISIWWILGVMAFAEEDPLPRIPEMEPALLRFKAAVQAVENTQAAKKEKLKAAYVAALDAALNKISATGDLDGSLQVKAEKDRILKGEDPSDAQKAAMLSALKAVREKYDRALEPLMKEQRTLESTERQRYVADLDVLQRQLTVRQELEKAQTVKAAKDENAKLLLPPASEPLIPTVSGAAAMDPATAFRMRGLFDKLKAGAGSPRLRKNLLGKRDRGKEFQDLPKDGGLLVGLEVTKGDWFGAPLLKTVQPIYLSAAGKTRGAVYGKGGHDPIIVEARDGYAVGAIIVHDDTFLWSLQLTFMKIDPLHRTLNAADSYQSEICGDIQARPDWKPTKKIAGDGVPIIGIIGWADTEMNALSVIQTP